MKVLIQKKLDGEFLNANCYEAWDGFYKMGYDVGFFVYEDLLSGKVKLDRETIVHGSVAAVRTALKELGISDPLVLDYPSELRMYLGRKIERSTMGEFVTMMNKEEFATPKFVKPVQHKLFVGMLVKNFADLIKVAHIPDDTEVWVSAAVDFKTEWRIFVLRGQVIGVKNYNGNPWMLPSKFIVEKMIGDYKNAPVAYSLDVGVIARGAAGNSTLLVEVNDSFALGAYGLPSIRYCQMIEARWEELMSLEENLCNCGVSTGIRGDHESECRGYYLPR
jgi:hypothetical protein